MEYKASVNKLTQPLVKHLIDNADKLRIKCRNPGKWLHHH